MSSSTNEPSASREPLSVHPPGSFHELLIIAVPLVISAGSHAIMMFFDRLFLARYSDAAFAASLPAGTMLWSLLALPLGIIAYTTTFVSQYHGAGQRLMVRRSVWHATGAAIALGGLQVAAAPLITPLFGWFDHPANVVKQEVIYFEVMIWLCPLRLLVGAFAAFFNGRGRTKVVMYATIAACLLNTLLDAVFIFGMFGLPEMGIRGAALGTVISVGVNAAILVAAMLWENRADVRLWREAAAFDRELAGRMLRFGLPAGFQFLFDIGSFTVVVFLVGRISQEALGATNLAFQLNSLLFVPLIGLGQAVSTIVGHRVGEGDPELAKRSVRMAMYLGLAWTLPFIVVFLAAPEWTLWPIRAFASESLSRYGQQLHTLLWFVAAYSIFDLMALIYGGAIRGAGDTRFSLVVFIAVNWGAMVLPMALLEWTDSNTLLRAWTVVTATIGLLGVVFFARYVGGKWQQMSVIERSVIGETTDEKTVAPVSAT